VVCGDEQDCCLGTCQTRLSIDNCENCSHTCTAGGDWFCNPTMHDTDGDGVADTPGCDCPEDGDCPFF
jgi:hypothetical protein